MIRSIICLIRGHSKVRKEVQSQHFVFGYDGGQWVERKGGIFAKGSKFWRCQRCGKVNIDTVPLSEIVQNLQ